MGCTFCASTIAGFVRNLTPSEILSQIETAQKDLNIRISNVVLMGMGEPLDNFDNVVRFLKIVSSFGKKPMHVFGFLGSIMFFIGFLSVLAIGVNKLIDLSNNVYHNLITDSPWFYIALTTMMIGTQMFLAGFIADLVSRSSSQRNDYQIEEYIKCEKVNTVCKVRCSVVFAILCLVLDLPKVMNLLSFVLFRCAYTYV